MTLTRILAVALAAGGFALALPAAAQSGGSPVPTSASPTTAPAPAGSAAGQGQRVDPFGDATIPRSAAVADAGKRFDTLDTNHDGSLSPDELAAGRPMRMRAAGPPPVGEGRRDGMAGRMAGQWQARMFDRIDTNHDGKLSKDEFVAGQLMRFDRMDADHDGNLTKAERQAAIEAMLQRMAERMARGAMGGGDGGGDGAPPGD